MTVRCAPAPQITLLLPLLLLAACGHSEPFDVPSDGLDGPLIPGNPVRLTYADLGATAPTWTPDGTSVVYSYVRRGGGPTVSSERCIGILPATGGTITREICSRSVFFTQAGDSFDWPAVSPDSQLAFHHVGQPAGASAAVDALLLAPLSDPTAIRPLRSFPFQGPDAFYVGLSSLRWLGASRLAFVGTAEEIYEPCPPPGACDPVLVPYGRNIMQIDPSAPGAVSVVPGTLFATSVSAGTSADEIYFTLAGDSRVLRELLSTGEIGVVHDFAPEGIARDVHYADGNLVVVVAGHVRVLSDDIGPLQIDDQGGLLRVVNLGSGAVTDPAAPSQMWFRHPTLSPGGAAIAAEGFSYVIDTTRGSTGEIAAIDSIAGSGSIWLFGTP